MNNLQMFETATDEIKIRAQYITHMPDADSINAEYQKANGYLYCLRDMEIFDQDQYDAAVDLLNAALHAVIEKAPSGVTSTERGKANESSPSLDENSGDVKSPGYTALDLALALRSLIFAMRKAKLSDGAILCTISMVLIQRWEGGLA